MGEDNNFRTFMVPSPHFARDRSSKTPRLESPSGGSHRVKVMGEAKITFMFTHKRHMYSTLRHTGEEVKGKKEKQLTRARENQGCF